MIKWLIPIAASAVLMGCNSDSGGSGSGELNVSLKSPTYVINAESRGEIDTIVGDSALSVSATDFSDVSLSRSNARSVTGMKSGISSRISESGSSACESSGTVSYSVNGSGINDDGSLKSSGSASISLTSNNCTYDVGSGYEVENGGMSISLSWSGYNGNDTFNSIAATVLFDELSYEEYGSGGGLIYSDSVDGGIKASIANNESSVQIALSLSSSDINNQVITIETTTTVKQRVSDFYPYQGVVEVKGGNGTSIVYTVVANGVEVSLNGGQPELVAWDEI